MKSIDIPGEIMVSLLLDSRLCVKTPFRVKLEQENNQIIAEAVEFNEFGFGSTVTEAITDLQHAISELYFSLAKEQDRLGPDLQNLRVMLQQNIITVHDN